MSQYYPPPPGVDRHHSASRLPPPPGTGNHGGDSHRPPPPSFPPPPPPSYDSYAPNNRSDRGDRPSRSDRSDRSGRYQPSRRPDSHPLPARPQGSFRDHRGGDTFRPPQGDFTFRSDRPRGVENSYESYRPAEARGPNNAPHAPARGYQDRPYRSGVNKFRARPGAGFERRRPWRPFVAANRPILRSPENDRPTEDFADTENGVIYRAIDQLSDSDEADMDISDSENESAEPNAKRSRTANQSAADESVPKWSNPDPYTALPPVEETDKKKKDMVHLIRKARVQTTNGSRTSLPADDGDFIRCDSDSQEDEEFIDPLTYGRGSSGAQGVPGAPAGPRATSSSQVVLSAPQAAANATSNLPARVPAAFNFTSGSGQVASSKARVAQTASSANKRAPGEVDMEKSSDLGTRKRTHDDVLKLPSHAKLKPTSKQPVGGLIVSEWRPKPNENPCPWVTAATSKVQVNARLHMEIWDFYEHVRPRQFEDRLRANFVENLNRTIQQSRWRDREFHSFGSFMSGLYLPTGDMDLVLCTKSFFQTGRAQTITKRQLWQLRDFFLDKHVAVGGKFEVVPSARVPLVKFVDKTTGLKIDISFENKTGINAIQTFKTWKAQYPAMPILVTVIKQFLLMRGLNEPVNGGVGGFSVICMVVSMLQMMPQVQSGDMIPENNLGFLLMEFFDLYGNRFNHKTTALRLNPPGYVNKNHVKDFTYKNPGRLSIIDPNDPSNDISGGSGNYEQIVACFSRAHMVLQERMIRMARGEKMDSILEVILGGDYSMFREQRLHLRKLHEKIFGHCDE